MTERLRLFFFGGIDPIRLDMFRRAFAFTLLVYVIERARTPFEWLSDLGYHPSDAAQHWFYPPTSPVLPGWLVIPFLAFFIGCIIAVILGRAVRRATWLVLACLVYASSADYSASFTLNILYTVTFFILAMAPSPVWVKPLPTQPPVFAQTSWPVRMIQLTILIQFFTAGVCKVFHGDWIVVGGLKGDWQSWDAWFTQPTLDALWTHAQGLYCTELCAWLLRTMPRWTWTVQQYAALIFECFAPLLIGIRRIRWIGILWGLGFLLMISLTMYNLFYFAFQLASYFILFLHPQTLCRIREMIQAMPGGTFVLPPERDNLSPPPSSAAV